jgi:hypothetical protein
VILSHHGIVRDLVRRPNLSQYAGLPKPNAFGIRRLPRNPKAPRDPELRATYQEFEARAAAEQFAGDDYRRHDPRLGVSPVINDLLTVIDDAKLRGLGPRLVQCVLVAAIDAHMAKGNSSLLRCDHIGQRQSDIRSAAKK